MEKRSFGLKYLKELKIIQDVRKSNLSFKTSTHNGLLFSSLTTPCSVSTLSILSLGSEEVMCQVHEEMRKFEIRTAPQNKGL